MNNKIDVSLDISHIVDVFVSKHEVDLLTPFVEQIKENLESEADSENQSLGWLQWPNTYDSVEVERIKQAAVTIQEHSEVFIVIGIGGSYLGAKAALEFLNHTFYNQYQAPHAGLPEIYFAGTNLSASYLTDLIEYLGDRSFSLNVISKSGTTIEPSIAFNALKDLLVKKYGETEAVQRIYVTTDKHSGLLRQETVEKNYESFVIPDNIGGRFTVLTPVGLLPIAVSGQDIDALLKGAADMFLYTQQTSAGENISCQYALLRNILYRKGYNIEMLVNYEPALHFLGEWWKQLFGESEGKDQKGIFPATGNFTTDLHSMGQFIQDGKRHVFETVLHIKNPRQDIKMTVADNDSLSYLNGKTLNEINSKALEGTLYAHLEGQVPNFIISIKEVSPYALGQLFYFFEYAVAISGYLNGVNPFDQPGVESYKDNMFALLGRPGYEDQAEKLKKLIKKFNK